LEVKNYLRQKGCEPLVSDTVIAKLRSLNYLDDLSFAQIWARSRLESRGYVPRRVEQELRLKGIVSLQDAKAQHRAVALLQRRGFSSKVIFELLKYRIDED
jgi:SOS response regulatory protein OraA/RecX